jgi:hypothetical protein
MNTQLNLIIAEKELYGLYLLLKKQELNIDSTMNQLLIRLEKILYTHLTIDEIENLSQHYEDRQ